MRPARCRLALSILAVALAMALAAPGLEALAAEQLKLIRPDQYHARVVAPRKGRVVLVHFFQTSFEPCREELPELKALSARFPKTDLAIFLVSVDARRTALSAVPRFLARERSPFVCFQMKTHDPRLFFHAVEPDWQGAVPFTVVYGRDGRVAARLAGRQSRAALSAAVVGAMASARLR